MHLLVTQPYLPAYRVPLFQRIATILEASGDRMTICVGRPTGDQELRGDSIDASWAVNYRNRSLNVLGRSLNFRSMPLRMDEVDVVVSELEALNTFAWRVSLTRKPLVLWGHGKSYVNDPSWLGDQVEWALCRRASHLMTYSPGGRDYLVQKGGFNTNSVTAIGNSTDTSTLRSRTVALRDSLATPAGSESRRQVLYVGGLDPTKRVDFLLDAAREAHALDPSFRLHVVGRGVLEAEVDKAAADCEYIVRTSESRGNALADIGWESDAIWMPGRVGLVAVDALAMGLPVHTTPHDYHAPEVEFLRDGELVYLGNTPADFAAQSLRLMELGEDKPRVLRDDMPTIESVAANFAQVVYSAYESRAR